MSRRDGSRSHRHRAGDEWAAARRHSERSCAARHPSSHRTNAGVASRLGGSGRSSDSLDAVRSLRATGGNRSSVCRSGSSAWPSRAWRPPFSCSCRLWYMRASRSASACKDILEAVGRQLWARWPRLRSGFALRETLLSAPSGFERTAIAGVAYAICYLAIVVGLFRMTEPLSASLVIAARHASERLVPAGLLGLRTPPSSSVPARRV